MKLNIYIYISTFRPQKAMIYVSYTHTTQSFQLAQPPCTVKLSVSVAHNRANPPKKNIVLLAERILYDIRVDLIPKTFAGIYIKCMLYIWLGFCLGSKEVVVLTIFLSSVWMVFDSSPPRSHTDIRPNGEYFGFANARWSLSVTSLCRYSSGTLGCKIKSRGRNRRLQAVIYEMREIRHHNVRAVLINQTMYKREKRVGHYCDCRRHGALVSKCMHLQNGKCPPFRRCPLIIMRVWLALPFIGNMSISQNYVWIAFGLIKLCGGRGQCGAIYLLESIQKYIE